MVNFDPDAHFFAFEDARKLNEALRPLRESGQRIVFTNGAFDLLHRGHLTYLKEARDLGDLLVLGLNSDEWCKRTKGADRPYNRLEDRAFMLLNLKWVDYVISFPDNLEDSTATPLVNAIKPDIYVKGGDYTLDQLPEAKAAMAYGGEAKVLSMVSGYSTTNLAQKIRSYS